MTYRGIGTALSQGLVLGLLAPNVAFAQASEQAPAAQPAAEAPPTAAQEVSTSTPNGSADVAVSADVTAKSDVAAKEDATAGDWDANQAAAAAPRVAQAPAAATTDAVYPGGTDHSRMVRTFAIGYLGESELQTVDPMTGALAAVDAPIIGGRYWLTQRMGIDLGIGFSTGGQSVTVNGMETKTPDPFALALRVGVPFALLDTRHFVFEVIPEATVGFTSNTIDAAQADFDVSSTHFDLGARAGAEVHFGFIGIPQLALQAGVGLRFSHDGGSVDQGGDEVVSFSSNRIATSLRGNPWDIFIGNIAALYYFGR